MAKENELPTGANVNEEALKDYMLSEHDDLPEVMERLATNPHRISDLNTEF